MRGYVDRLPVDPPALAGKMANSIDSDKKLQRTYLPNQTAVRLADEARERGRGLMWSLKNEGQT